MSYTLADSMLSANLYILLCVQRKTADDGQRNCPKHVEFYSKNKFQKLVNLVGFIIRMYHDARSPERHTNILLCRTKYINTILFYHYTSNTTGCPVQKQI